MSAPNAPTLAVVNDGTGTSATATIGSDAGAINQLFCKQQADALWTAGATITGPGTVQQTGLNPNVLYFFQVVSADPASGNFSLPSNLVSLPVAATATPIKTAVGAAVETLLRTLVPSALSMVTRPTSAGMPASPQNLSCYILQTNPEPPADEENEVEATSNIVIVLQPYCLYFFAQQSDSATTPVDEVLNGMEAAIVAALLGPPYPNYLNDPSLATAVDRVWFDAEEVYFRNPQNSAIFGQMKRLMVQVRHVQESLLLPSE
jgi:hypothetical protein